jgi:hypothetical protein
MVITPPSGTPKYRRIIMNEKLTTEAKAKLIDEFRDRISSFDESKQKSEWKSVSLPGDIYRELKKAVLVQGLTHTYGDTRSSFGEILKRVINWELLRKLQTLETDKPEK